MFGGGKAYYMLPEDSHFETISDFKWCLKCGGEIQFRWKGKDYALWGFIMGAVDNNLLVNSVSNHSIYDSFYDALEYMIGDDRLRDIITQAEVLFHSI